jgi:chromosome partitioning protein
VRTIAVINAKGGCGKSAIAVNVAAALGERGRRTLLVDLDPQGSASDWLGGGPSGERELFDAFVGTRDLASLAGPSRAPLVDLVAASSWLVTAERTLQVDLAMGAIRAMERLPEEWDFVLVDCPPTLGYLATAALCGVSEALLPTEAHGLGLSGVDAVLDELDRIHVRLNPGVAVTGIVISRLSRTNHARDSVANLRSVHGDLLFEATVRDSIRVPEAAAAGLPVILHTPAAPVAGDVRAVAAELIRRDPHGPAADPDETSRGGWRGLVGRLVGASS